MCMGMNIGEWSAKLSMMSGGEPGSWSMVNDFQGFIMKEAAALRAALDDIDGDSDPCWEEKWKTVTDILDTIHCCEY